jgi:transcription antitermination factor NusG
MRSEQKFPGNSKWFAVYTKPRWEKKVAGLFNNKGVENYCPLTRVLKQWSDRKKIVLEPLIRSYVFVHITDDQQASVRNTPGVINFVYWLGKPAVVKEEEIIRIKKFLNEYDNVKAEKAEVRLNDKVRIVKGPLMMEEGKIIGIKKHTVKLILPGLGYNLIAEVSKDNIELASLK